ncbi:MAG: MerR family transcriptional regulator, partial [Actinomycetes bacterium]
AGCERGKDLSELLGLEKALIGSWSEDRATVLAAEEIAGRFGGEVDPRMLRRAVELGVLEEEGDRFRVPNLALLDAAAKLVGAGVPLDAVLDVGRQVAASLDGIAGLFVDLVNHHVFEPVGDVKPPPGELRRLADLVTQLRPLAELVCDAQLALAMERRIQVELGAHLARLTDADVAASQ